jgi:hypothetical protein
MAVWWLGPEALDAPLRRPGFRSVSFPASGSQVLRGRERGSFAAFRSGASPDRSCPADALRLDGWWRGLNVLAGGGEAVEMGPASVRDHAWTQSRLLDFADPSDFACCTAERGGCRRHAGPCGHRRSVLFVKDDLWIVADRLESPRGRGVRLEWLPGASPYTHRTGRARLVLHTSAGPFSIAVLDESGRTCPGDLVGGAASSTPAGPPGTDSARTLPLSLAVEQDGAMPVTLVSVICGGLPKVQVEGRQWRVRSDRGEVRFRLEDGSFRDIALAEGRPSPPRNGAQVYTVSTP